MKELTIKEAVCRVLGSMGEGEKLLGYELCNKVRRTMSDSGSLKRPMDGTILRRVRENRDAYGIDECHSKSEYRKQLTKLTEEEKQLGQRAMF